MRPRRILLVDDSADNLELYSEYLRLHGFHVLFALDGGEAVTKAVANAPDVIVMDLTMPVVDGLEATRRLRSDERTRHIPIVILTGNDLEAELKASEAGCNAYLLKPCAPDDLISVVDSLLDRSVSPSARL